MHVLLFVTGILIDSLLCASWITPSILLFHFINPSFTLYLCLARSLTFGYICQVGKAFAATTSTWSFKKPFRKSLTLKAEHFNQSCKNDFTSSWQSLLSRTTWVVAPYQLSGSGGPFNNGYWKICWLLQANVYHAYLSEYRNGATQARTQSSKVIKSVFNIKNLLFYRERS